MILLGNSGVMIEFGKVYGIDALANFDLYTGTGLTMIYVYFQIPLSTLLLIPAFEGHPQGVDGGVPPFWERAPHFLDPDRACRCSAFYLGTISVLFANALAAYATAYALLMNNYALLPINISGMFVGDVTQRKEMGGALSVVMMLLMVAAIFINNYIAKKNRKVGR